MVLPRHATIYHNAKQLAWSTCSIYLPPIWKLSTELVRVLHAFLQSHKKYRFRFGCVEWHLINASPGRYSSSNFIQLSANGSNRGSSRKRYLQSAYYKGRQYHDNHDSSHHQRLNDLIIWNIWRVQDYK